MSWKTGDSSMFCGLSSMARKTMRSFWMACVLSGEAPDARLVPSPHIMQWWYRVNVFVSLDFVGSLLLSSINFSSFTPGRWRNTS